MILSHKKALEGVAEIVLQPSIGMNTKDELDYIDCCRTL